MRHAWGKANTKQHAPVFWAKNFVFDLIKANRNLGYVLDIA
jgi:hypothetical protein